MRSWAWGLVALTLACGKKEEPPPAGPPDAGVEEAPPPGAITKPELEALDGELTEIGKVKGEADKRRELCLALEPKVAAKLETGTAGPKLELFAGKMATFCSEAVESRRLMKKAAEPRPPVPELAAAMKASFTASMLKGDLASAQALLKKKGDPTDMCKRIEMTTHVVGEKKKQDKKTKKLVKEASAFCAGPAVTASFKAHLEEAQKAEKGEQVVPLAEHCTTALVRLVELPAGKSRDALEAPLKTTCREAYALKDMLQKKG